MVAAQLKIDDITAPITASPPNGRPLVLFAGEHTHPQEFSTMHAAYNSGKREADRLNQAYGR